MAVKPSPLTQTTRRHCAARKAQAVPCSQLYAARSYADNQNSTSITFPTFIFLLWRWTRCTLRAFALTDRNRTTTGLQLDHNRTTTGLQQDHKGADWQHGLENTSDFHFLLLLLLFSLLDILRRVHDCTFLSICSGTLWHYFGWLASLCESLLKSPFAFSLLPLPSPPR